MIRRGDGEGREGGEVEREYGDGVGEVGDEDNMGVGGEGWRTLQRTSPIVYV